MADSKDEEERIKTIADMVREQIIAARILDTKKAAKDKPNVTDGVRPQEWNPDVRQTNEYIQQGEGVEQRSRRDIRSLEDKDIELRLRRDGIGEDSPNSYAPASKDGVNIKPGERLQIVLVGPDEAGAFSQAYDNLRGKSNVVFYNMNGKSPDQMKADLKEIRDKYGVAGPDGKVEYDTHIFAHGFQGKDGKEGGMQVGTAKDGRSIVARNSTVLSTLPDGARFIVTGQCEGGAIKHSAQYAPEGAIVTSFVGEGTVGWSDNIAAAYAGHGNSISGDAVFAKAVASIDRDKIAKRNADAENWTKVNKDGDTVYAYRSIIRGENGKQIFSDRADQMLMTDIGVGRRRSDGTVGANDNIDIATTVNNKFVGLEAHKDAAIKAAEKALPAHLKDRAAKVYDDIVSGKKYEDLQGQDQNIAHILATQLQFEKDQAERGVKKAQERGLDGDAPVRKAAAQADGKVTASVAVGPNDKDPQGHATAKVETGGRDIKMG
ncbi:MAG: hypothetical protein MRY32_09355 [Rickettsiales bacterium]|nr:hypothetical protein [Rickettsiales bacterium]